MMTVFDGIVVLTSEASPAEEETGEDVLSLEIVRDKFGGYWGDGHPDLTLDDWRVEVANNDTRLGYWDWVWTQLDEGGGT